jgi:hypothetical protein
MPLPLKPSDWWTLLRAIDDRQCVLLLGPGVAIDPGDPTGDSLPVRLAKELAVELQQTGKGGQVIMPSDLAHVAQTYEREMESRRADLEFAVSDFYKPYRDQTTPLHEHLAALPFNLCISTTPDRFLLNAFVNRPDKDPIDDFYDFKPDPNGPKPLQLGSPELNPEKRPLTEKRPLIYGLYGSIERPASLVLTENDLLDFLVNVTRKSPALHPYVTSRLSEPGASFVFLGFGFHHWYIRILLHVLKAHDPGRPSLALESADFFGIPERPQTALFFSKQHLIKFYNVPWVDFAAELRERFDAAAAARPNLPKGNDDLAADAPVAFLCHENRDKPQVELVMAELQARRIKVWLDQQNLRGGDRWPVLIPSVLEKHCNYVVVLQSPRMLDKEESYCFLEIDLAAQRQPKFSPGLRYLIPTILETDPRLPLEPLRTFHCIDLTEDGGIDSLARTILEDWRRRQDMKRSMKPDA